MDQGRSHRREEARQGFPLLRGCPSTVVLRRLAALDRLSEAERLDSADQLSELVETLAAAPMSLADRTALVEGLPLVSRVEADVPTRPDLRFQTVKSLARLAAEPGGIAAFVDLQGLEGPAAGPPVPHVPSFAKAVPAPPAKLRKMGYSLWADLDGVRMTPTSYETVWLLPSQWDLITVGNVEAAATHLVRVVEARLGLEG